MKKIKFRAWDNKSLLYSTDCSDEGIHNWGLSSFFEWVGGSGDIVQRFTGIQDCNKKDLYEGDILKVKGYFKGEYEEFSIGVVEWNERDCGFCINIHKNGEPYWDIYYMNEIQERGEFFIVGNIFENGELLK